MDAQETLNQLANSLAQSMQEVSNARNSAETGHKYAELTGRLDTLSTILNFLRQNIQVSAAAKAVAQAKPKKAKSKRAKGTEEEK